MYGANANLVKPRPKITGQGYWLLHLGHSWRTFATDTKKCWKNYLGLTIDQGNSYISLADLQSDLMSLRFSLSEDGLE